MAKYKRNEETELSATVSPFESEGEAQEIAETPVSKKQLFEVAWPHKGQNFAIGGKYYNTGSENFISPGGTVYRGIGKDQDAMQEIYDFGPIGANYVKAPKGYRAKWEKFV